MPKLTVVIPTYTGDENLEQIALEAIRSYSYQADELIVCEDGGRYSPQMMALADVYIYNHKNEGFSVNVNRGWRYSTGDFTAIVSSDTRLYEGDILNLCIPGKVTSPEIVNQHIDRLAGPFFVVPKEIKEERGMLLEQMRTYCSDSEYDHRVKDIFEKVPQVKIFHHQAKSVTVAGVEGGEEQRKDRKIYERLIKEGIAAS